MVYLIGSLRNPEVPKVGNQLRKHGFEVFDDWYAASKDADDAWRDYEKAKGRTYLEALSGPAANTIFNFDRGYLDRSEAGVLVLPAGKSAHIELGYLIGRGKRAYILLDALERWDVMYKFATGIFDDLDDLIVELKRS